MSCNHLLAHSKYKVLEADDKGKLADEDLPVNHGVLALVVPKSLVPGSTKAEDYFWCTLCHMSIVMKKKEVEIKFSSLNFIPNVEKALKNDDKCANNRQKSL